jgi:hypothetical protein
MFVESRFKTQFAVRLCQFLKIPKSEEMYVYWQVM